MSFASAAYPVRVPPDNDEIDPEAPSDDDLERFAGDDAEHSLFPDELPGAGDDDAPPRPQWLKLAALIALVAFFLAIGGWMLF